MRTPPFSGIAVPPVSVNGHPPPPPPPFPFAAAAAGILAAAAASASGRHHAQPPPPAHQVRADSLSFIIMILMDQYYFISRYSDVR